MATMTQSQFWDHMRDKAAMHISAVTDKHEPETEAEVKEHLECTLRRGSAHDQAEVIIEAVEWQVAHMMDCMAEAMKPA